MEKCIHKVKRIHPITGDPLSYEYICVKCGEKAKENLTGGETNGN